MVLYSQSPRHETGRKDAATARRGVKRWLLIGAAVIGCGLAGTYLWLGESQTSVAGPTARRQTPPRPKPQTRPNPQPLATIAPTPTDAADKAAEVNAVTVETPAPAQVDPRPEPQPAVPVPEMREAGPGSNARLANGMNLIADQKFVEGRRLLSELLIDERRRLTPADAQAIRDTLSSVNKKLVFSPEIVPGDPLAEAYVVQPGDLLARIAPQYQITYQVIERVNNIQARNLRAGQTIKLIKGPFHARVIKHDYRMDLFVNDTDGTPLYVCSFPVGIGQDNSTPEGAWVIGKRKATDPDWRNPRTNEYFRSSDPNNPIGEFWVPLTGTDENTRSQTGYGIHGTIEPDSIGTQASMGCIRLRDTDIEQVFHMLVSEHSTVEIVP